MSVENERNERSEALLNIQRIGQASTQPDERWFASIDFGVTNPFACVWGAIMSDGRYFWTTDTEQFYRDNGSAWRAIPTEQLQDELGIGARLAALLADLRSQTEEVMNQYAFNARGVVESRIQVDIVTTYPDSMSMRFDLEPSEVCWKLISGIECGEPSDPESETGLCASCRQKLRSNYSLSGDNGNEGD